MSGASSPDRLGQQHQAQRPQAGGQALVGQGRRAAGQQHHPPALRRRARRPARAAPSLTGTPRAGEHVGRPQHQGAAALQGQAAPLARRRERDLLARPAAAVAGGGLGDRAHRRVLRARRSPRASARSARRASSPRPSTGSRPLDPDPVLGERAGLVEAERVDRRQALDRVEALGERADARQPHRGDGEGQAREQHEPLGHQGHEGRDDGPGHLAEVGRRARQQRREQEQRRGAPSRRP